MIKKHQKLLKQETCQKFSSKQPLEETFETTKKKIQNRTKPSNFNDKVIINVQLHLFYKQIG